MNKSVLVVDDQESILEIVKIVLENSGYDVSIAFNGKELFSQVKRKRPDLIVLDISLKQEFGGDLARKLKRDYKTADIPIMFFSANHQGKKIAQEAHADDYLEKPFDSSDLIHKVQNLTS